MSPNRQSRIIETLKKRQPDLTVLLENVEDPHNISAVMRSADSIGIQDIYVLNTKALKPKKHWGWKSSGSALQWLTVHEFTDTETCMNALREAGFKCMATHLGEAAVPFYEVDFTEKLALVFGSEQLGISKECLAFCEGNFIIPQAGMVQSLNISVACAVTLYEAFRQRTAAGCYERGLQLSIDHCNELARQWKIYEPLTEADFA